MPHTVRTRCQTVCHCSYSTHKYIYIYIYIVAGIVSTYMAYLFRKENEECLFDIIGIINDKAPEPSMAESLRRFPCVGEGGGGFMCWTKSANSLKQVVYVLVLVTVTLAIFNSYSLFCFFYIILVLFIPFYWLLFCSFFQ